jgi:uncharacterized protein YciI
MSGTVESNRAGRIRLRLKARQRVAPADLTWLSEYEKTHGKNYGRSASGSRKVSYTEEETNAAAEGLGSAADIAAAAMVTRAEGERLDSILTIGIKALTEAVNCYKSMTAALLEERQADAQTHRALLESLRSHFLERAEAEAELIRVEADHAAKDNAGDTLESAATQALVQRFMKEGFPEQTDVNSHAGRKG